MATETTITPSSLRAPAPMISPPDAPRIDEAAQTVFDESFEQTKTSRAYGLGGHLKYGFLSNFSGWLSEERQTKLDLYNKHAELCAGIDKVKKAHQKVLMAEKAVKAAKDPSSLKKAQEVEKRKAQKLMSRYTLLIRLAVNQASELKISEIEYKADLHRTLNKESLIFHTLNRIAGKFYLFKNPSKEGFEADYERVVSNLVLYIQEVFNASGQQASVQMITEALIEGLAAMPEFVQDNLRVFDCYMALAKLKNPSLEINGAAKQQIEEKKAAIEKSIKDHFLLWLNQLMEREVEITKGDIGKIKCQGISLFQWRGLSETELSQLNRLKGLKAALKAQKELLETDCELIATTRDTLEQKTTFTLRIISEFLELCKDKDFLQTLPKKLENISDDHPLFAMGGYAEYKKAALALAQVDQKLAALTEEADREMKKLAQNMNERKQKIAQLKDQELQLREDIQTNCDSIASMEQNLTQYQKEFQIAEKEWNSLSETEKYQFKLLFGRDVIRNGEAKYLEEVKKKESEIDQQKEQLQLVQNQIAKLQVNLDEAMTALEALSELEAKTQSHYSKPLLTLQARRSQLAETSIELSGKTIGLLLETLGIKKVPSSITENAYTKLTAAFGAHFQIKESKEDREQEYAAITEVTEQIIATGAQLGLQYLEGSESFVFQPTELARIQDYVDSNLDIAAEVTARVLDSGAPARRQNFLRQLDQGGRLRQAMAGEGLYHVISSRIGSATIEKPESVEVFEVLNDDLAF